MFRTSARLYWLPIALFGVAVFAIAWPTYIGWWVYDGALGAPLWRTEWWSLYGPHDAVRWWWQWGHDAAFMAVMRAGAEQAAWISFWSLAAAAYAVHVNSPLPAVETDEQQGGRFGTVEDLVELGRVSLKKRGIVIGRQGKRPVYHTGDDHVGLIGTSRVGEKGTAFVLPTVVDCPDSLVIFDPKGTLFEATADERRKLGPTYLFDVTRPGCAKFNPLLELRGGDLNIDDCEMQGQLMTYGMDAHADPFWRQKAAELLAGLVRHACLSEARPSYQHVRVAFRAVRNRRPPETKDVFVRERIEDFLSLEERPRTGVAAQVSMALRFTSNPTTMESMSRSEWRVSDLCCGKEPTTTYLTFPPANKDVLTQVTRLVLQSLFLGMIHHHAKGSDGRPKTRRVTWVLEEFPELGHLPFIEHAMAIAAEYGLRLFLVAQDLSQIQRVYGREQSLTKNCGHMIFSTLSESGHEYATKMCGTLIAPMRARHRKIGVWERQSETASQSRHPVLNPRDARLLTKDHALVIPTVGAQPVWIPKARWYEMPCYAGGRIRDTRWMEDEAA